MKKFLNVNTFQKKLYFCRKIVYLNIVKNLKENNCIEKSVFVLKSAAFFKCKDIVEKYKNYLETIKILMKCKKIYEFFSNLNLSIVLFENVVFNEMRGIYENMQK